MTSSKDKSQPDNLVDMAARLACSRAGEGRAQVLERLFREHNNALRTFLKMRLGIHDDMEDIVQEVFVRLARMKDLPCRLPAGDGSNRSFLYKIANNVAVDLERRKLVRRHYIEEQQAQVQEGDEFDNSSPESQAEVNEQLERLKAVLMTLKPKCRDVFILNRYMNKSYNEVAMDMGLSVKQVEKYMHQALMRVRKSTAEIKGVD